MTITVCPLTGYNLQGAQFCETFDNSVCYIFKPVGKVSIGMPTMYQFQGSGNMNRPELAGICRNAFENGEEPPMITEQFLAVGIRNLEIPKSFPEKARHLLLYLYKRGGNEYKEFVLQSSVDYPLCYAEGQDEFKRIFSHLENRNFITVRSPLRLASDIMQYRGVLMTDEGIKEAEKSLPQMPLIGLISQQISTGDSGIDEQINHAKQLFLNKPQSREKMRSACEVLSYVLEPLRNECELLFGRSDTQAFFQIVNTFDIRHNKPNTMVIEHTEQLEWVFYTLLNSINTYYKIKLKVF